ncbi:ankyrin repeat-containing domain protein [Nemania sp. FL0916]|nr:ankyrin repeat-containing domain protein [Nemania sp. FL0916]
MKGHESQAVAEKALQCAISAGDSDGVQFFLDARDLKININEMIYTDSSETRYTALELAIKLEHISIVRILLSHGADPNKSPSTKWSQESRPLNLALRYRPSPTEEPDLVILLLQHGAVVCSRHLEIARLNQDQRAFRALFRAGTLESQIRWARQGFLQEALTIFNDSDAISLYEDITHPSLIDALNEDNTSSEGSLFNASVRYGKKALVRRLLLDSNIKVHKKTPAFAAANGDAALLRLLLDSISHEEDFPSTVGSAYPSAIRSNVKEVVDLLEEYGAHRYIRNSEWHSARAFEAAFTAGNFELAKRLLDLQAPCTPEILGAGLFKAVELGQQGLAEWLIDLGADPKHIVIDDFGQFTNTTTLSVALQNQNHEIVRLLLRAPGTNLSAPPFAPIIKAVEWGDSAVISELVLAGSPVNTASQAITPLILAIMRKDRDTVNTLLQLGACVNLPVHIPRESFHNRYPSGKAGYGYEVMRRAIWRGDISLVKKLIANNVRFPTLASLRAVHTPDNVYLERTPLVDAIERRDVMGFAIFRMILDADADVGVTPKQGAIIYQEQSEMSNRIFPHTRSESALLVAIHFKQLDKVRLLVERGADVNSPAVKGVGRTPLQAAAEAGDFKIAEFLIHSGADVNAPPTGYTGATALQLAAAYGYAGIVDLLLRSGADVNAPPSRGSGRTALEVAAEYGRLDTVVMLLDAGARTDGPFRPYLVQAVEKARSSGHLTVANLLAARDAILSQEMDARGTQKEIAADGTDAQEDQFIDWGDTVQ